GNGAERDAPLGGEVEVGADPADSGATQLVLELREDWLQRGAGDGQLQVADGGAAQGGGFLEGRAGGDHGGTFPHGPGIGPAEGKGATRMPVGGQQAGAATKAAGSQTSTRLRPALLAWYRAASAACSRAAASAGSPAAATVTPTLMVT